MYSTDYYYTMKCAQSTHVSPKQPETLTSYFNQLIKNADKFVNTARSRKLWTYNFVEVSGLNLDCPQTWGFQIQCLHYKPVSNHFYSMGGRGGGGGGWNR